MGSEMCIRDRKRAKRTGETTISMHIFEDEFGPPGEEVVGESTAPGDYVARTHKIPSPTLGPEALATKKTSLIPKETISKGTKKVSFSNGPENGSKSKASKSSKKDKPTSSSKKAGTENDFQTRQFVAETKPTETINRETVSYTHLTLPTIYSV